jgi:hypothetical protein
VPLFYFEAKPFVAEMYHLKTRREVVALAIKCKIGVSKKSLHLPSLFNILIATNQKCSKNNFEAREHFFNRFAHY